MGSSFVMNLVLASSLSLLWGLLHALQIVTHFPLSNVIFPSNAETYFEAILEIANLGVIPTENFEEYLEIKIGEANKSDSIFNVEDHLSESTIEAGYDSADAVLNNIFSLVLVCFIVFCTVVILLLRLLCFKVERVKLCLNSIWRMIFWNFIIRSTMETYLELCLVNMIRMYAINFSSWYEVFGSSYAILILTLLTLFSLLSPVFLLRRRDEFELNDETFIKKFGSLAQELNSEKQSAKFYAMCFMLRRLCLASILVYLPKHPLAQVQLICFTMSLQVIFIGYSMPFTVPWMNNLEVSNEFLVLISSYFLFMYSDGLILKQNPIYPEIQEMVKNDKLQYDVGFCHVGILGVIILQNLVVILTVQAHTMYKKAKLQWLKWQNKKLMKKNQ